MDLPHPQWASQGEPARIVLRGNASLSARAALWVFLGLAVSVTLIGILFAISGAWLVIPFLGLELVVVGAVFCRMCWRARDCEVLTFEDDRLHIIQHRGKSECRHEFQRYWARVALEPVRNGWYPPRLLIRSHGREVEIGTALNEDQRMHLAQRLRQVLGPGDHVAGIADWLATQPN
jgi:uncharacterized membrane protein